MQTMRKAGLIEALTMTGILRRKAFARCFGISDSFGDVGG
jgi:hypothetical protein